VLVFVKSVIAILTVHNASLVIYFSTAQEIQLENVLHNALLAIIYKIFHAFYANPNAKLAQILQTVYFVKMVNFSSTDNVLMFAQQKCILLGESVNHVNILAKIVLIHILVHLVL
jgi:hypothetical protein